LEKELADNFIKKLPEIDIQLFSPDMVYKYNHKGETIKGFDTLTPVQQDTILFSHSKYIQFVKDSIFLDRYVNSFIDELRILGFKVFVDNSIDSVLLTRPQAYVVNFAQIQLDEYLLPFEDSETIDETTYYKTMELNAADLSSWVELSKLNAVKPAKTILYSSFSASDGFNGRFYYDPFSYNVRYKYKVDSLKLKDVYELSSFAGKRNASYLFDYFMNQYITYKLPDGEDPIDYFHYNRFQHSIAPAGDERFDVLDNN